MRVTQLTEALRAKRDERLSHLQAAEFLGIKPHTLACWRSSKRHEIPFAKIGSKIFYRVSDLEAFIDRRTVGAARAAGTVAL